jgi:exonuclease III
VGDREKSEDFGQPMKILIWNILHGGGPRRTPAIALAILDHRPDLVVLTEFRMTTGGQLAGMLHDHGLAHQSHTDPPPRTNGILLACRFPITEVSRPDPGVFGSKLITASVPGLGVRLCAAHVPDARAHNHHALTRKSLYWNELLDVARRWRDEPAMLVGDLNTGRPGLDEDAHTLTSAAMLGRLGEAGFSDAYRHLYPRGRDRSWYSPTGSGFRLDHALTSASLTPRIESVGYSQTEREERLSDHAPMLLEIGGEAGRGLGEQKNTQKEGPSGLRAR